MTANMKGATAAETDSAILDLIRSGGVVSRINLANSSGLTGASISRIVKRLLADGLIVETGVGDPTGGKPRTLLQLNGHSRHAVGISLDVEVNIFVITDLCGDVVVRQESAGIGNESPSQAIQRVSGELNQMLSSEGIERSSLLGIGIAAAGRQDAHHHVLRANPPATEWELFALEDTLSATTGLPVVVENDSTCAAIGEFWIGRIPATADFAALYMANGFGLGLVTRGDVYRGSSSNVGEIGHMVVDVDGPDCWCGSRGCLETLAAPKRIVEQALEQVTLAEELGLRGQPADMRAEAGLIFRAASEGHPDCVALIEQSAGYLSKALLSTTNLLDLDQIILAGPGFSEAGSIYLRVISEELERLSFVRAVHPTKVTLSRAGMDSASLGAASLVLHSRLTPHQTTSRLALAR